MTITNKPEVSDAQIGIKHIMHQLEAITRLGYDFSRVFNDWLTLMTSALCQDEDTYMDITNSYRNDGTQGSRPADYFAYGFAALMRAHEEVSYDYLGDIFTQHVTRGQNGQFFTPDHVCELMVKLTMTALQAGQTVCDPACGSGRMLYHAASQNRFAIFYGVDIDQRCAQMTALNLLFRNVNATVIWGNALTLECWGGYITRQTMIGGTLTTLSAEDARSMLVLESIKKQAQGKTTDPSATQEQLILL